MNNTGVRKKRCTGFTLFEVAVFLIIFSLALGLYVQTQYTEHYTDSALTFSVKLKEFTVALKKYLNENQVQFNDGVNEIPVSKIIQSGQIGADSTGTISNYIVRFYAYKQLLNGRVSISGLVTATPKNHALPFKKAKADYIEGLLGQYGGRRVGNTNVVNGNWGLWVLDLNHWKSAQTAQLFSYFPGSLDLSRKITPAGKPKIYDLSFENCSFGRCETSDLPVNDQTSQPLMEWDPVYNEDYFRIMIKGDKNVIYYFITITVTSNQTFTSTNYMLATTAGGVTLFGKDYAKTGDADISVAIQPVSSHNFGDEFTYTLHKGMPKDNVLVYNLWKSIDIDIDSAPPGGLSLTETCRQDYPTEKLVNTKDGKLSRVDFVSRSTFTLAYNVVFSFFGNKFFFPKNGELSLSYVYSDKYYPWFFITHPDKNSGAILSCIVENGGEKNSVPDAAVIIDNKQYDIRKYINMTSWSESNHVVHITLK
ncbi:hypothetical protein EW785_22385 [Salmonella enterica]|nr:hypothetical protein [Salmonella enterica]